MINGFFFRFLWCYKFSHFENEVKLINKGRAPRPLPVPHPPAVLPHWTSVAAASETTYRSAPWPGEGVGAGGGGGHFH